MFRATLLVLFLVAQVGEIWSAPLGAPPQHQTPDTSISEQTRLQDSTLVVTNETVPVTEETEGKVKDDLDVQTKDITQVTEKYNDEIITHDSDKEIPVRETKLSPTRPSNFKELLSQARQRFLFQTDRKTTAASFQPSKKRTDHILENSSVEQRIRSRHSLLTRLRKLARKSSPLENVNITSVQIANGSSTNLIIQENTNTSILNNLFNVSNAKITDFPNEQIFEQPKSSDKIFIDGQMTDSVSGTATITGNNDLVRIKTVATISPQEYFRQQQIGVEFPALQSNLTELVRNVSVPINPQGRSLSNVSPINIIQLNIPNHKKNFMHKLQLTARNVNTKMISSALVENIQNIGSDELEQDNNVQKTVTTVPPAAAVTTDKTTESIDGQYEEINPGQYHEVNPGQYHEVNPGQYSESNPGQYHELNPGQYTEVNPGQVELQVEVDESESIKTYNVHKKTGDYIIGEVGKIDIKNGQTFEGVRYTAVDGILDQKEISEILQHYFGTQTSR